MTTIPTQLHDDMMLSTEQVAAITGLSKRTLEGWRYRKEGPAWVPLTEKAVKYRWGTLRAFIQSRTVTPAA
jgi:predicted DNA-binding transcriptional regulator AlpA